MIEFLDSLGPFEAKEGFLNLRLISTFAAGTLPYVFLKREASGYTIISGALFVAPLIRVSRDLFKYLFVKDRWPFEADLVRILLFYSV